MTTLVYAHDGDSVYDSFFLNHLLKNNRVYLLTFSEKPKMAPPSARVVRIPEPFHPTASPLTGLNFFLGSFVRSIFLRLRLNQIDHNVLISNGVLLYGFYTALANYSPFILFSWGSDVLVAPRLLPFRFIAKYSLKKASAVVVNSDAQEKACIALGCSPKKIVKFPWVDMQAILRRLEKSVYSEKGNADKLREKLGWERNDPVIISTRQHKPIYNIECLIQAIPCVVKEVPNARFLILGKGDLTQKLKESVAELGYCANVKFLGEVPVNEIPGYLKIADIYVSTSLSDGTSASLIEAMVTKLPVAVTDIPGNREWITDSSSGLLFPANDSKVLAERILRLLRDEDLRKALAARAYKIASMKADWRRNSKLLDNLISRIASLK